MSVIHEEVRFDVLRNGVKVTELKPDGAPTVQMHGDSSVKSCLSGIFMKNDSVDWLRDEIQPVFIRDGVSYSFGVFSPVYVRNSEENNVCRVDVEAYDRCWKVQSICTEGTLHLNSGDNYIDVIKSLLSYCGISLIFATECNETLRADREDWGIGTDYLSIINVLLAEINYNSLWFDELGYAVIEPKKALSAENISESYRYGDIASLMIDRISSAVDLYDAPNVFVVVCSNTDGDTPLVAKAVNDNPMSPLSVINRGRRISRMFSVDNIASATALQEYALFLCQKYMLMGETINISTAFLPSFGVNRIVSLVHPETEGICLETDWTMTMEPGGIMNHVLKKVVIYG